MNQRLHLALAMLVSASCVGNISEALVAQPFTARTVDSQLALSLAPSFADERGGGVFIDTTGRVVRLRSDGSQAFLESHPSNATGPGTASAIFPLGPYSALVSTGTGLFVAESGWLIAPSWQALLPADGLIATAIADNGIAWLAHANGLFRLENGALNELKMAGASITGVTALGSAPSTGGGGVWFARGETISNAVQTATRDFVVHDSGLTKSDLKGGVTAMVGIAAARTGAGELWAITPKLLFQFTPKTGWRKYELGRAPKQLAAAGRVAWLQSGDVLYRYDADLQTWGQAGGVSTEVPTVLAVDAAGVAWVRFGETTTQVSPAVPLRVEGLFQNATVYASELVVQTSFAADAGLEGLLWSFDDGSQQALELTSAEPGTGPQASLRFFSFGGNEAAGLAKAVSFAALADGLHTLNITAALSDGSISTRALHFETAVGSSAVLSWARDIKPISESRCAKCHTTGTMPELASFEQWQMNSRLIETAVRDRRMPADGPLDPGGIQAIGRWVNGGMTP